VVIVGRSRYLSDQFVYLVFCAKPHGGPVSRVVQLNLAAEQLLTKRQLAQHLSRSTRWVELRVREGMPSEAPTTRYPQRRFRLSEVEAWLAAGKAKPPAPQTRRLAELEERAQS
jgi:hypothetical protein